MKDIIIEAKELLDKHKSDNGKIKTGKVRSISAQLFKKLDDTTIENVLAKCEQLLNERSWALGVIAYDWAFRVRKQYHANIFSIFERWLKQYVTGWGDCDDFCTHAFGELLAQNNALFTQVIKWTKHPDFFVRRAAAVILIYPIKHGHYEEINPYLISDALMHDDHYLVLKGYGWMLKILSQKEPKEVYNYLQKNKAFMPRVAYRYALEKLDKDLKIKLMEG